MKTTIYIIAICLLVLMAVPAIMPVESIGNSAFADDPPPLTNCPSCTAWRSYQDGLRYYEISVIVCLDDPEQAYYFHYDTFIWVDNPPGPPIKEYTGHNLLLVQGSEYCDDPCHEYTCVAKVYLDELENIEWNLCWIFGSANPSYHICEGPIYWDKPWWIP